MPKLPLKISKIVFWNCCQCDNENKLTRHTCSHCRHYRCKEHYNPNGGCEDKEDEEQEMMEDLFDMMRTIDESRVVNEKMVCWSRKPSITSPVTTYSNMHTRTLIKSITNYERYDVRQQ
ncbi:hypothetical protein E2P81_ATG07576 [Venturia nashicola]|nr:hypothetical protein E2P81_ATG07576 [Venturia nashicola]